MTTSSPFSGRIAKQLIVYMVLFSSLITLFITAFQLYRSYKSDISIIHNSLEQVEQIYLTSISNAVWKTDMQDAKLLLNALIQIRDMQYFGLHDDFGLWIETGKKQSEHIVEREFSLTFEYRGTTRSIGHLRVQATLQGVYQRLMDTLWTVLISNAIKTFLVAGFMLLIFQKLVTRHLQALAQFASNWHELRSDTVNLGRRTSPDQSADELHLLENAFNDMQRRINETLALMRESERTLQRAQAQAQIGHWMYDELDDVFTCSRELTRLGVVDSNHDKRPIENNFYGNIVEEDLDLLQQHWQSLKLSAGEHNVTYRIKHRTEIRYMHAVSSAQTIEDNSARRYFGTIQDITEIEKARQQTRLFQEIVDTSNDFLAYVEPGYKYKAVNREYVNIFGKSRENIIGMTVEQLLGPEMFSKVRGNIDRAFDGEAMCFEAKLTLPDQNIIDVEVRYLPHRGNEGDIKGIVVNVRDITARKQTEEIIQKINITLEQRVLERTKSLELANHELESFCYSVSHDLRAPLRAIDGYAQIILEENRLVLSSESRDQFQRIRNASQQMGKLIDALLNLSRLTRGKLQSERVNLSAFATQIIYTLQSEQPQRRVSVKIEDELYALGDAIMLQAALQNLLSNAWKYTRPIQDARITIGKLDGDNQEIFFVRDNGVGFDMKYKHKLFGAFQRLHHSEDFEGLGIGLATVQRIVHRHGGDIWAESELNKGSTFYFTINSANASELTTVA